jgi:enoyl-[acyl-carrier-protein] reductase (NADH)
MSSAKAALESDTRVLAFEAGRKFGVRVNTISAGPLGSRAAKVCTARQWVAVCHHRDESLACSKSCSAPDVAKMFVVCELVHGHLSMCGFFRQRKYK